MSVNTPTCVTAASYLPVIAWWLYDIFYITPFLGIPYLHTVNREIFTDRAKGAPG
jgi:hypothetical protein